MDSPTTRSGINIRVNQTDGLAENETAIAANPTNPLNLVGAARRSSTGATVKAGYYSSSNGGQTWTEGELVETTYANQTDPAVAFCADGSAVYVTLSLAPTGSPGSGIFAYRSTDGGLTWPAKSTVVNRPTSLPFPDKPWLACDPTSSSFSNRVYVEWMDVSPGQRIKLKWSANLGATWSAEVVVSDTLNPQNQGVLAIGPGGQLYVAWNWLQNSGDPVGQIRFDKSTNGGVSFGTDVVSTSFTSIPTDPHFIRITYPAMDVDRSTGPHSGTIYIAFADNRNGDPDILLVRSTDGGTTWSTPVRVNDDVQGNGADQFHQWLSVDPLGRVVVAFYDRRRFVGQDDYEIWGAISRDGGVTFDTNFLISDTASNADMDTFLGDYTGLVATSDRLYALWADQRPGTPDRTDVYTDRYLNNFAYDEVKGVAWLDDTHMDFEAQDARFGVDLDYDVASGLLSELRADGGFGRSGCAASLWPAPPFVDGRVPPLDDGFYSLVRSHGPAGVGTYGDAHPAARPNVRDTLDEALAPCP